MQYADLNQPQTITAPTRCAVTASSRRSCRRSCSAIEGSVGSSAARARPAPRRVGAATSARRRPARRELDGAADSARSQSYSQCIIRRPHGDVGEDAAVRASLVKRPRRPGRYSRPTSWSSSSSSSSSRRRRRSVSAGVVADLEALEQLVAAVLVDRRLVGDQHPVGALVLLHVEDLGVELGRVVDDDEDLGLRVEVGPRTVDELVELEACVDRPSARSLPVRGTADVCSEVAQPGDLALDLGLDVERRLARRARGGGCGRSPGPGSRRAAPRRSAGRSAALQLQLDVDRRLAAPSRRALRASSSWRISVSRSSSAAAEPAAGARPARCPSAAGSCRTPPTSCR